MAKTSFLDRIKARLYIAPYTWKDIHHFIPSEFDSPDMEGSGEHCMYFPLIIILDKIREETGVKMVVNSGFRTDNHNEFVGGKEDSQHPLGYAADIACTNSEDRWKLVESAMKHGIKRIIVYKTFIHFDMKEGSHKLIIL